MAHRTATGTKMAAAFANIFMEIENKSGIEPYRGHQRIFIACSGMPRLQADRSLAQGRSLEAKRRSHEKKRFSRGSL